MGLLQPDNLVRIRQPESEPPSRAEMDGLIRSGNACLQDAQIPTLSIDGQFDLAYNAAHAFAQAALRWYDYRSEHRFTVFNCIAIRRTPLLLRNGIPAYGKLLSPSQDARPKERHPSNPRAEYRASERIHDERSGDGFDFCTRQGVVLSSEWI